jgi:hypothetical protein
MKWTGLFSYIVRPVGLASRIRTYQLSPKLRFAQLSSQLDYAAKL